MNERKVEWKSCIRLGVTVVAIYLVIHYWPGLISLIGTIFSAATPLIVGGSIAYVVNILMRFYERHFFPKCKKTWVKKIRRPLCMLFAFATGIGVLAFLFSTIVPELMACVTMLMEKLPGALQEGYQWLDERIDISAFLEDKSLLPGENFDWKALVENVGGVLFTGVGGVMGVAVSAVMSTASLVITLCLALVFSVYLMSGKETIGKGLYRLVRVYAGEKVERRTRYFLRALDDSFHHFIVGQFTEALILGSLCILGMLIFQFPYAVMIGSLVGVTALIPIAGAYFAGAVGAFMIFTVEPIKAVLFVVFLIVLQQLEGNLIYPRTMGSTIKLPGIWVLTAVMVGGGLLGIVGMLLGVPLAAAVYQLVTRDLDAREKGFSVLREADGEKACPDIQEGAK